MNEFQLIDKYFTEQKTKRKDVVVSLGDDAAVITPSENSQLVVTTDTLVEGVHFFADHSPRALGHKVVAVNLSDLAAMGAEPKWLSLSLSIPDSDEYWLSEFTKGLFEICEYYHVELIGGDTVRGPRVITVCAKGTVPTGTAITRDKAQPGDSIYITGTLGDAALAVKYYQHTFELPELHREFILNRLNYPKARVAFGQSLRGMASAAIDISDGLISDLQHIVDSSKVGASIHIDKLPYSDALQNILPIEERLKLALAGGDDYELLFTIPSEYQGSLEANMKQCGVQLTCIGKVNGQIGKIELLENNKVIEFDDKGYDHFI